MPSKILFDSRTKEIKRSQTQPHGLGIPSKKALISSARIPENEVEFMDTCIVQGDYLTYEAQEQLRIIEAKETIEKEVINEETGEIEIINKTRIVPKAILKSKLKIIVDKKEVNIKDDPKFILTVKIIDTLEGEEFTETNVFINNVPININLIDNKGSQVVELAEVDTYVIQSKDKRFRSEEVKVEGV